MLRIHFGMGITFPSLVHFFVLRLGFAFQILLWGYILSKDVIILSLNENTTDRQTDTEATRNVRYWCWALYKEPSPLDSDGNGYEVALLLLPLLLPLLVSLHQQQ